MNDSTRIRPRLSIGMPVFNGGRFLPAALESLLAQTFTDYELIISDNASSDETQAIAEDFARRDARIVYVRQMRNQGAAWNFNFVFERAVGDYFKWAAADDACAPTFLARCVEVLDRDPDILCCHARTQKIDENGRWIEGLDDPTDGGLPSGWFAGNSPKATHRPDASSPSAARRFADVVLFSGWAARSYSVFRARALRETSLLLPYYGSEKLLMAELALRGRFYDVPETLFFQRVHDGCSSRLKTSSGQRQYIAGSSGGRQSPRLQLLRDYCRTIAASSLPISERMRCYFWLLRYLLQFRKWPDVLSAMLRGGGVGSVRKSKREKLPAAAASVASCD